ncbi:MAG: peptidylprolyl isomerase [bacterium]|nr:peptidylprolyl isomerase [bacterium]
MTLRVRFIFLLVGLCCFSTLAYAWEPLDKIVAVVGDRVVLASELQFQLEMYETQAADQLKTPEQKAHFKEELLRQMINDRLILIKAKEDTSIVVDDKQVDQALEERMTDLRSRFRSTQEFENQLAVEGYTMRDLRNKLRVDIHDQLVKDRLVQKLLSKVSVTRDEVEKFYSTYRDSLPPHPNSIKLAHLLLKLTASSQISDSLKLMAESLRERISQGESFEALAEQFSEDPSAEGGGDIGTFRKGDLVPEYEKAALALNPGEVSPVVHTAFGYHIIKLVGKADESFHTKHILLLEKSSNSDSTRVYSEAEALVTRAKSGEDWATLVKDYSTDDRTRANFGELGWYALAELPDEFKGGLVGLEIGGISKPVWSEEGLHIIKLLDRKDERAVSLADDYDMLKEYARRQKSSEVIAQIVDEMKERVYIDLRGI